MEALQRQQGLASTSGRGYIHQGSVHSIRRRHSPRGRPQQAQKSETWSHYPLELPESSAATQIGVVQGFRTLATPRLTPERVFQRMTESAHPIAHEHFHAFFSSVLGGITTDPGFMILPIDDKLVTRGHGVADSCVLADGHLYLLDEHIQRMKLAAEMVGIPLPYSESAIKRIILDTAAASMKLNGRVRFWLTRGRANFGVSDKLCTEPSFYVLVTDEYILDQVNRAAGLRVTTTPVEPRPAYFASICSNQYLQNCVAQMEAESRGYDAALFVDAEGNLLEMTGGNVAILTHDDVLVYPPFDQTLPGITMQRAGQLGVAKYDPHDMPVRAVEQRDIKVEEALKAKELLAFSSAFGCVGIGIWEHEGTEHRIGNGRPGTAALALYTALDQDMDHTLSDMEMLSEVPYGYLTGMREQLK